MMEYGNIVIIKRKSKCIVFFLKEGESMSLENIIDVEVHNQPERLKWLDSCKGELQGFPYHGMRKSELYGNIEREIRRGFPT